MNKAETMAAALKHEGCLGRSADDEPVFVLCGRDPFASIVVREWADRVEARAHRNGELDKRQKEKIASARVLALDMDAWRARQFQAKESEQ